MFRAIWLAVKFLLSALLAALALFLLFAVSPKQLAAGLWGAGIFALLAALPWVNWGTGTSPLGAPQSPRELGPYTSTILSVVLLSLGGAMASYSTAEFRRNVLVPLGGSSSTHSELLESTIRALYGISLGVVILLAGFVLLFKALPRLGIAFRGPFRALASPEIPKPVLKILYVVLGVWFVLLQVLSIFYD